MPCPPQTSGLMFLIMSVNDMDERRKVQCVWLTKFQLLLLLREYDRVSNEDHEEKKNICRWDKQVKNRKPTKQADSLIRNEYVKAIRTSYMRYLASEWDEDENAGEMSPGSSTESYPAFAHIGLRETPGKNPQPGNLPRPGIEPGPPGFAARRANRYFTGVDYYD
ncbi:hypothetical protein ANN_00582 [Periplaneta americana]|uniref:Uncharacterized protein n=1 Tax=Periplaneta americana TaxID=6978 RepID=A0ABQ8TR77_PERAM|nr:hypothetical protein ANN_00582 [Periplaneta americana]